MIFKPTFKSANFINGDWRIVIDFVEETDPTNIITQTWTRNRISREMVQQMARNETNQLNAAANMAPTHTDGELIDITPPTPDPIPPPSQAEIDAKQWVKDWRRLQQLQKLVDHGVNPANNQAIVDLRIVVRDTWKNIYISRV